MCFYALPNLPNQWLVGENKIQKFDQDMMHLEHN